jgi:hypothetical protein
MTWVKYTQALDDPGYRGFEVYLQPLNKKLGVVEDLLLDVDTGLSQYLIVRVGVWPWSHSCLLPFAQVWVDYAQQCFYISSHVRLNIDDWGIASCSSASWLSIWQSERVFLSGGVGCIARA